MSLRGPFRVDPAPILKKDCQRPILYVRAGKVQLKSNWNCGSRHQPTAFLGFAFLVCRSSQTEGKRAEKNSDRVSTIEARRGPQNRSRLNRRPTPQSQDTHRQLYLYSWPGVKSLLSIRVYDSPLRTRKNLPAVGSLFRLDSTNRRPANETIETHRSAPPGLPE